MALDETQHLSSVSIDAEAGVQSIKLWYFEPAYKYIHDDRRSTLYQP